MAGVQQYFDALMDKDLGLAWTYNLESKRGHEIQVYATVWMGITVCVTVLAQRRREG